MFGISSFRRYIDAILCILAGFVGASGQPILFREDFSSDGNMPLGRLFDRARFLACEQEPWPQLIDIRDDLVADAVSGLRLPSCDGSSNRLRFILPSISSFAARLGWCRCGALWVALVQGLRPPVVEKYE